MMLVQIQTASQICSFYFYFFILVLMCHFLVGGHICAEDLFLILLVGYCVMNQSCEACVLKVSKCEIFDPFFFTSINPIWVGDLRTGEFFIFFRRLRQIFAILCFLRIMSVR